MITRNDQEIYERHGASWWDPDDRVFASLRSITGFRMAVLDAWLEGAPPPRRAVDMGCGGGLLTIPLVARGMHVVGIDRSRRSLACAAGRAMSPANRARSTFLCADATCPPLADGCADLVLLADVLEHLDRPEAAIQEAARLLSPGGALFVNTLNRTRRSRWLAVTVAEGVGLIPRGTHAPEMFVRPEELDGMALAAGLHRVALQGERVRLWQTLRQRAIHLSPSSSVAIGYSAFYRKQGKRS
jgi:2-polyprenyl-6-hydroxyphenyl methylase/3-demethylubiquinone-9 3-methyltransferase